MEETLAPTVVESHVPERTQRRGELRRTSVREEDNGFFFVPSPRSTNQERTKPEFLRGVTQSSRHKEGSEGLDPQVFFFWFFVFVLFLPLKEDSVFRCCGFFLGFRRKHDGRRGRSEGATEAESRLFDAVIKREEAHDQFAKPLWYLHAPRTASRRR